MNQDRDLVEQVLGRRAGAFESLVRAHQGLVSHIVRRLVRNNEDVRELCQEVFLRTFRRLEQFRGESSLRVWIGRIAYSIALRFLERHSPTLGVAEERQIPEASEQQEDIEHTYAAHEAAHRLHMALSRLAPIQRVVISLYHLEEMDIGQVATITDLPVGTVKSHLFRARRQLRDALQDPGEPV